jgi:hypothetical protein
MARINVINKGIVDGRTWYTIICDREVESWVSTLKPNTDCCKIIGTASSGTIIDIREDIYMFAMIKWNE